MSLSHNQRVQKVSGQNLVLVLKPRLTVKTINIYMTMREGNDVAGKKIQTVDRILNSIFVVFVFL